MLKFLDFSLKESIRGCEAGKWYNLTYVFIKPTLTILW